MREGRVLIFEGAPGAGKSSLSQYVAERMKASGEEPVWIEEHDLNDIWFDRLFQALDEKGDAVGAALECWRALLVRIDEDQKTYLLDGAYFHTALKSLLSYGYDIPAIEAYLAGLHRLFLPHEPILVHLTGDTSAILRSVIAERGALWAANLAAEIAAYPRQHGGDDDEEAMIDFFVASQRELAAFAQRYPFKVWTLDTTGRDWSSYQKSLADWLDLDGPGATESLAPATDLAEYVGIYQTPEFFPEAFRHPLTVELSENGLRLHTVFMRNFRLVPREADRFAIAGRPLQLDFVRDETGQISGAIYPFVPDERFFCARKSVSWQA